MKKEIHAFEPLRWMKKQCGTFKLKKNSKAHTFSSFCEVNVPDYEQNDT